MADYSINIFIDDAKLEKLKSVGLDDQIMEIGGKKAVKVSVGRNEHKKLVKGFPGIEFDDSGACVLPEEAEAKLMDVIVQTKTLDVIKVAIMKIYNPLAGKAPRSASR